MAAAMPNLLVQCSQLCILYQPLPCILLVTDRTVMTQHHKPDLFHDLLMPQTVYLRIQV